MTVNVTKTDRVIDALSVGDELTAAQLRARFGFSSTNAVRGVIANLRNEGFCIYSNDRVDTKGRVTSKYRLGTPTRAIVAAGIRALAEQGQNPLV